MPMTKDSPVVMVGVKPDLSATMSVDVTALLYPDDGVAICVLGMQWGDRHPWDRERGRFLLRPTNLPHTLLARLEVELRAACAQAKRDEASPPA